MAIGVSTACFYPLETERALRLTAESDADCCEIFLNSLGELRRPFLDELRRIAADGGLRVSALHAGTSFAEPTLFFSDYPRRFEEGRELYRRYGEAANLLGARFLIFHGDKLPSRVEEAVGIERFGLLAEDAAAAGLSLLQENVNRHRSADPAFLRRMRAALGDRARFCFDVKQAVRAGFSPAQVLDAMGDAVRHIHLSDHRGDRTCLLPGRGDFDFAALFDRCRRAGYTGDCMVEVYRDVYRDPQEVFAARRALCALTKPGQGPAEPPNPPPAT